MKLTSLDYSILRAAFSSSSQGAIAKTVGATPNKTTRSLLKLAKGGALTISRGKQGVQLRPHVVAMFAAVQSLEDAARHILECALATPAQ